MADASVFETGRLTDVWTPSGKDQFGQTRYRRANFDVLTWTVNSIPETYVLPLGLERINSAEVVLKDSQTGHEFGYYTADSLILEQHQGDGMSDTLPALHSFGVV